MWGVASAAGLTGDVAGETEVVFSEGLTDLMEARFPDTRDGEQLSPVEVEELLDGVDGGPPGEEGRDSATGEARGVESFDGVGWEHAHGLRPRALLPRVARPSLANSARAFLVPILASRPFAFAFW